MNDEVTAYDKLIEAGWITPEMCAERVAQARREGRADLAARIADLADEWTPNIGQGAGHYLNPRVVVRRLDAALRGDA